MGQPKQLLPLAGKPLIRHVVDAALGADLSEVVVVIDHYGDEIARALAGLPVRLVENPRAREGQSTSVHSGLAALSSQPDAVVFLLADQPCVGSSLIRQLIETYERGPARIVVSLYRGQRGSPVMFDRSLFPELMATTGDEGGRSVIRQHQNQVEFVPIEDPLAEIDVDTWEAYQRLLAEVEARQGKLTGGLEAVEPADFRSGPDHERTEG